MQNDNIEYLENFERELRRGSLVLVVLVLLEKPTHGYDLLLRIEAKHVSMDTDTLYPLLRRLEAQDILSSLWDHTTSRPRKIYQLTERGKILAKAMQTTFETYHQTIKEIFHHD
jgi:DNA-binding PadR family transcriptional regulator